MTDYLDLIDKVVDDVECNGIESATFFEKKIEKISDSILKYSSRLEGFSHIMVFLSNGKPKELTFVFDGKVLLMSKLKNKFGSFFTGYNFRENYTEFSLSGSWNNIDKVFFTLDNKFDVDSGGILETDPYGAKKHHADIDFDFFCLRLKEQEGGR